MKIGHYMRNVLYREARLEHVEHAQLHLASQIHWTNTAAPRIYQEIWAQVGRQCLMDLGEVRSRLEFSGGLL
jgi:hypothetical protein